MPPSFPENTTQDCTAQRSRRASATGAVLTPLHLWHLASLDAPTVALVWASSFAWVAGNNLPLPAAVVVFLSVWTIYVGDRLLDARASLGSHAERRLRERHYFHWHHRRLLVPIAVVVSAITAVLVLACIPIVARERDSVLAAVSLAYFARVHSSQLAPVERARPSFSPLVTKELLVGVLFAVGCALPSLGTAWAALPATCWGLIGCVAFFALLAWLNCLAIDRWESGAECGSHQPLRRIAFGLAAFGAVGALLLCFAHPRPALLLVAGTISALLIALLDKSRARLNPVTLRAAADLVLLAPALLIPFEGLVR